MKGGNGKSGREVGDRMGGPECFLASEDYRVLNMSVMGLKTDL